MSLFAVRISKDDTEFIAELNEDYHNGDCLILDVCNTRIEDFSDLFDYVVIDNGEYMIKIYSPLSP
jgi:hypothetical protein